MKNLLTNTNLRFASFSLSTPFSTRRILACTGRWLPRATMAGALMSCASGQVQAQWTNENVLSYNSLDMKHYATSAYSGSDEYVMAGTVFNYTATDDQAIHVVRLDNSGNTVLSKIINTNRYDERVIGVHTPNDGSRDAIVVASRRNIVSPTGIDGIEILRLDGAGNVSPLSDNIESSDPTYFNMYPMGSLLLDEQLYICGYATQTFGVPDLSTDKIAFVLRYDLSLNVVAAIRTFEFSTGAPPGFDPDMAMRMKLLNAGLWVGGSCWDGPMMNMVLDPASLSFNVSNTKNGRISMTSTNPDYWESSFDALEDPATGGVYIFGNTCDRVGNHLMPRFLFVDGYDKDLTPILPLGKNRWQFRGFDYAWGTNIVPSLVNGNTIILSGFESNRSCNNVPLTSTSNINPFLYQVEVKMAGGDIVVTPYWWNTLLSYTGTGNDILANAYYNLGNGQSGLDYGPVNTVRDLASTTDIMLNAPVWNTAANRLNIKWIRADQNGELSGCDWQAACGIVADFVQSPANGPINASSMNTHTYGNNDIVFSVNPDGENLCSDMMYRNLGTSSIESQSLLTGVIYPNPATNEINLKLTGGNLSLTDKIQVRITDMMGRMIGNLYQGTLKGLPQSLSLPAISPGIYSINIYRNESRMLTLPLTKQ